MDDILERAETDHRAALDKYPNPACMNHPDRLGSAFFRGADKKIIHSLCMECLEEKLEAKRQMSMAQHDDDMAAADKIAKESRNGN